MKRSFAKLAEHFQDVLRMNEFRTKGFEDLVGARTTIAAVNPITPWSKVEPGDYSVVWALSSRYASRIPSPPGRRIEVIYRDGFGEFITATLARCSVLIPRSITLSMGAVVTLRALADNRRPTLVNFDWAETGHYFAPEIKQLWQGHAWAAEKKLMLKLEQDDRVEIVRP